MNCLILQGFLHSHLYIIPNVSKNVSALIDCLKLQYQVVGAVMRGNWLSGWGGYTN